MVSLCIGGRGFPATCGSLRYPFAMRTTSTAAPFPGAVPRPLGIVRSVFEANQGTPRFTASAASVSTPHGSPGPP